MGGDTTADWQRLSDPGGNLARFVDCSAMAPPPALSEGEEEAGRHKEQGNRRFRAKAYTDAAEHYTKGLLVVSGGPEEVTLLANRAAALLAAGHFGEALTDCHAAAEAAAACVVTTVSLRNKIEERRAKAAGKQKRAAEAAADAASALAAKSWAEAIPAFEVALKVADKGGACRAELLCGRGEAFAAVGDFAAALADAQHSHAISPSERAAGAIARLGAFLGSRSTALASQHSDAAAAAAAETGMAPLQALAQTPPSSSLIRLPTAYAWRIWQGGCACAWAAPLPVRYTRHTHGISDREGCAVHI
jgi:tetratricopeptide (TPR) repeat protein